MRAKTYGGRVIEVTLTKERWWHNVHAHVKGKTVYLGQIYKERGCQWATLPAFGDIGHDCIDGRTVAIEDIVDIAAAHGAI